MVRQPCSTCLAIFVQFVMLKDDERLQKSDMVTTSSECSTILKPGEKWKKLGRLESVLKICSLTSCAAALIVIHLFYSPFLRLPVRYIPIGWGKYIYLQTTANFHMRLSGLLKSYLSTTTSHLSRCWQGQNRINYQQSFQLKGYVAGRSDLFTLKEETFPIIGLLLHILRVRHLFILTGRSVLMSFKERCKGELTNLLKCWAGSMMHMSTDWQDKRKSWG